MKKRVIFSLCLLLPVLVLGEETIKLRPGTAIIGKVKLVNDSGTVINSFGGGTEYTEGDTDSTITGGAILWEDAGNTLVTISAAKPLPIDITDTSVAITAAALPLPSGASQEHTTAVSPHSVRLSDGSAFYDATKTGQLPSALVSGRLDVNVGNIPAVSQSGTWTVQPGNTANTTPWLMKIDQTTTANDVDVATLPNVTIGTFPDNEPFNVAQINGVAPSMNNGGVGTGVQRVTIANDSTGVVGLNAGTNRIGSVRSVDSADADLTSVKATQTSRFLGVQEAKDAGRTSISFYANAIAAGTTGTETLITLTQSKGTGATSSASTYTMTSGKRFRITELSVASRGNASATIQITTFNLRLNTGGACLVGSTPILVGMATATPATASAWDRFILPLTDGYEIAGDGTASICISAAAVFVTNAPTWFVNILGYEY